MIIDSLSSINITIPNMTIIKDIIPMINPTIPRMRKSSLKILNPPKTIEMIGKNKLIFEKIKRTVPLKPD